MRRSAITAALATTLSINATAMELPAPKPSARDMYVACYLLVNDNDALKQADGKSELYSSSYCNLASLSMIANREGKENPSKYKFCLDSRSATSTNIPKAMAFAYLDFYEGAALKDKGTDGSAAYLFAMMARWPCRE